MGKVWLPAVSNTVKPCFTDCLMEASLRWEKEERLFSKFVVLKENRLKPLLIKTTLNAELLKIFKGFSAILILFFRYLAEIFNNIY